MVKTLKFLILVAAIFVLSVESYTSACIPPLPAPHANNAVASLTIDGKQHLFSFAGLKKRKNLARYFKGSLYVCCWRKGMEKTSWSTG